MHYLLFVTFVCIIKPLLLNAVNAAYFIHLLKYIDKNAAPRGTACKIGLFARLFVHISYPPTACFFIARAAELFKTKLQLLPKAIFLQINTT